MNPTQLSAKARANRIWLGYVYALGTILALTFVSVLVVGIITQRGSLIVAGLFMSVSFALFWRDVGSRICRNLRRRRENSRDSK